MLGKVVIIEDNPADAKTLRVAIARHDPGIEMVILEDGLRAIDYFSAPQRNGDVYCDLVLLDLNLPHVSGFEVLDFLKTNPGLKNLPVVILSGSSSEQDISRCYASGANSYICKPTGIDQVFQMASQLIAYWFDLTKRPKAVRMAAL